MEIEINSKTGKHQKETASLNTLSELFDIPLWTLRKYASERRFPGIIKRGRSIYVDLAKFRAWLYSGEIQSEIRSGGTKIKMSQEKENPNAGTQELDDWIIEDLAKSGLTTDNFTIEPLRSEKELKERLGFTAIQDESGQWIRIIDIGGYWILYPNGHYRLKLRGKIGDAKYLSPRGKGNHPYILPEVEKQLKNYNPDKPIFITEGEKKAAKATLEGFLCIGLSGVWNFKDSETDFLPELDQYIWTDRTVYIVFDSDISQKHNVKHAELRLAVELMNRGAMVYSIRLPNTEIEQ